jgi:hypothetical protein
MATRKDVEAKAARQGLMIRTKRNPQSGRVHFRFWPLSAPPFDKRDQALTHYDTENPITETIGARAALCWLKSRAGRLALRTGAAA